MQRDEQGGTGEAGDQQLPEYVSPWATEPIVGDPVPPSPPPGPGYGAFPPPPPPRRRPRTLAYLIVVIVAAAAGAGLVAGLNGSGSGPGAASPHDVPVPHSNKAPDGASRINAQTVANEVDPGIVNITAPDGYANLVSEGTGIVLSSDGLVLTNNHVINQSTSVHATVATTGRTYRARVLGYDPVHDVALLQLEGASGMKTVNIGDSGQVKIGDAVLALGNAEGQGGTPTVAPGQVTALSQTISPTDSATGTTETLHGTIQTNSQIQEGDSGGPLANSAGQVIGMDTAASSSQSIGGGSSVNGYAIPIDQALSIARQIANGRATTDVHIGLPAFIGISVTNATSTCQSGGGGFGENGGASSGALVCEVFPGTPANSIGLQAGDVITAVNGKAVGTASALIAATSRFRPGESLNLTYYSATSNATKTAKVTLTTGPAG